jgi:tryptophanase
VHFLGNHLLDAGIPVVKPIGGHCIMLDMKRFLPHIPQVEFPSEAFASAMYIESGTRTIGLGQLAFGSENSETGEITYSPLEVVRFAIPRRVYTDNHMKVVAKSVISVYQQRDQLKGMKITWSPPVLRHFTAHLAPIT